MKTQRTPNGDPRRTGPRHRGASDEDRHIYPEGETHYSGSTGLGWLWALPLAALAGLGWYALHDTPKEQADVTASRQIVQPVRNATTVAAGSDLHEVTRSTIGTLIAALQGITDLATATAALLEIQDAAKEMERLAVQSAGLPVEERTALASSTREQLGKLNTVLDSASSLPGVAPVLQPAIASLRGRMDAIAMVEGKPLFFASAPTEWVPISSLYDREILDRAGGRVGTATGFLVASDGRIAAWLLSVDRQLGIGDKQVAVPFAGARLVRMDDGWHLAIDASKDDLRRAKPFRIGR